jgi:hypothetical protein
MLNRKLSVISVQQSGEGFQNKFMTLDQNRYETFDIQPKLIADC